MVNCKIIAIGDELLLGQIENTNAAFIAQKLYKIGLPVKRMVTIGDVREELVAELEDSLKNYNVTIMTGGLGPTHDDITKSTLVEFFNDKLVLNESILEHIKELFDNRGMKMPDINREQALVPSKAKIIWNENGTAPGFWFEENNKIFISLPGVPFEMKPMMTDSVLHMLREMVVPLLGYFQKSRTILTTGISESALAELIGDVKTLIGENNKLAFLPSATGVRLRIDVRAEVEEYADSIMEALLQKIKEKIGKYIYSFDDEPLNKIVHNQLLKKGTTIATAESCTSGMLAVALTEFSGSSGFFMGGVNSYSNDAKIEILGVNTDTIRKYGAVSEETAIEMATNVRKIFGTDIGVSITGIAGPTGGTDAKPVGLVYIGYADGKKAYASKNLFGNNRERNRLRAVNAALSILYFELF
ncbi:MAG: competence/damage-inducible protein A [Ignavibacteria bacterium]